MLGSALLLGWRAAGEAILGVPPGTEYWLVEPSTGAVRVTREHPGSVVVPDLELRRRTVFCPRACIANEVWLHDGRPGGRARLVLPFIGRFGQGCQAAEGCVTTWTPRLRMGCCPS